MPYLAKRESPCVAGPRQAAYATMYGDLQCPHCTTIIVTPANCEVRPGWRRCPRCRNAFKVTSFAAAQANEAAARAGGNPVRLLAGVRRANPS
ncbi:MAG: hypothetical protein A2Y77_08860 [Planctomycetes bacterium RBG_13_62_9]|nr:MAG: hypothetical protein A2Y77_08860 [Planctomycetes bacterium RBG_13_62_9]